MSDHRSSKDTPKILAPILGGSHRQRSEGINAILRLQPSRSGELGTTVLGAEGECLSDVCAIALKYQLSLHGAIS